MYKCKQCGSEFELKAGVRYCPNCAAKVDTSPQPAASADAFTGTISGTATFVAPERAQSSTEIEAGKEFHRRYAIERKLGQGAMGIVYLAGDKLTGRHVALKLINSTLMHKTSARERFLREGLIARDIRHKHVVAVYDVGETEEQYYLVMEYLSGETLRNWLHNFLQSGQDVPYATAEKIIRNILEGLEAAHTAGVIHRDVKPENIMLTGNPEAGDYSLKILDFGIARAIDSAANQVVTTTTSTGTALYMAPEQKTAADTVGPPADLYAVSAIFYELLLGVAPTGRWAPLSKEREDLPPGIDVVIDKGLSSRPRSRYQNAQEYLNAINGIRNTPRPAVSPSSSSFSSTPAAGIKGPVEQAKALFDALSAVGLPKTHPVAPSGSAQDRPAAAKRVSSAPSESVPVPQMISSKGRLRTERLVWSNAPAEGSHQSALQALQAFGLREMQSDSQSRTVRGTTGFNWRSFGQNISATVTEVSGGSTVNIIGQTKGPALADMGNGKKEVRRMSGMLIQKLTAAGWKAYVVREVQCSPPTWLVVLIVLAWLVLFGALIPPIVEFIDSTLGSY
jgi:serine/threonine protein kinase